MSLEKLPSVIRDNTFTEDGLVRGKEGLLVPAYVASQLGFSESGRDQLGRFYERLQGVGVLPLCPFKACSEYLDSGELEKTTEHELVLKFWEEFNSLVGPVNYGELMPRSKMLIALLDGGHGLDDGVCAEIGFFAATYDSHNGDGRPIIGIRSDFRLAENPAAPINPAVRYFMDTGPYGGKFFSGQDAYEEALEEIQKISESLLN